MGKEEENAIYSVIFCSERATRITKICVSRKSRVNRLVSGDPLCFRQSKQTPPVVLCDRYRSHKMLLVMNLYGRTTLKREWK